MIKTSLNRWAQPLTYVLGMFLAVILISGLPLPSLADEIATLELDIDLVLESSDEDAEYILGNIGSVVEDTQGNIFVGDLHLNVILKFTAAGELLSRYSQTGEGPGDLMPFFTMAIDGNDRLFLAGLGGRVAILDTDFKYLASFKRPNLTEMAKAIDVFPDGSIAIAALDLSRHTTIDLLDASYQHQVSFSDTYAAGSDTPWREETIYAGGLLAVTGANELVFVQSTPYLVRLFSSSGTLLSETAAGGDSFVPPPPKPEIHNDEFTMRSPGGATGIAPVGDDKILVAAYRVDDDAGVRGLLCLYDKELKLIGRRVSDYVVSIAGTSANGRVYLQQRKEEGTRVVRARVRLE